MKEYLSTTGGRHLYNSDLKNLQELALASFEVFKDCGQNFVVSGCTVSENTVSEGYAFVGGKMRYVPQSTIATHENLFIRSRQSDGPTIVYADGNTHAQCVDYAADVVVTNAISGSYIAYDSELGRFPNLSDVFFNHYALVKDAVSQSVSAETTFSKTLMANGIKNLSADGNKNCLFYIDADGNSCFMVRFGDVERVTYKLNGNGTLQAYTGSELLWQIGGTDGKIKLPSIETNYVDVDQELTAKKVSANTAEIGSLNVNGPSSMGTLSVSDNITAAKISLSDNIDTPLVSATTGRYNQILANTVSDPKTLWPKPENTAMALSAANGGTALWLQAGYVAGMRFRTKTASASLYVIGANTDDYKYTIFASIYSGTCTIRLPESPEDGQLLIVGRASQSNGTLYVQPPMGATIISFDIISGLKESLELHTGRFAILTYCAALTGWIHLNSINF